MNYCLFPFVDVYARVSQIFGVNRAAYARFGLEGHNGVDWAINVGTPILAAAGGVVVNPARAMIASRIGRVASGTLGRIRGTFASCANVTAQLRRPIGFAPSK